MFWVKCGSILKKAMTTRFSKSLRSPGDFIRWFSIPELVAPSQRPKPLRRPFCLEMAIKKSSWHNLITKAMGLPVLRLTSTSWSTSQITYCLTKQMEAPSQSCMYIENNLTKKTNNNQQNSSPYHPKPLRFHLHPNPLAPLLAFGRGPNDAKRERPNPSFDRMALGK